MSAAFHRLKEAQPHRGRAIAILRAHPEVRALFGRNPWTVLILLGIVAAQLAIAFMMGRTGLDRWWLLLLLAYGFGAFASHSLYVIVHEATHNLIFKSRMFNKLCILGCDVTNVIPGGMGFAAYHILHHSHLGEIERDADLPSEWEARLIGNRWYTKLVWLLFFPIFQALRLTRLGSRGLYNRWFFANLVVTLLADALVVLFLGWNALLYLLLSTLFGLGLHPLGARWIQEHYTIDPGQETASYYGALNWLALNVGLHNEHHDFPAIPWNRLPRLKTMAPEFYETLAPCPSWPGLLLQFIFDSRYSSQSRVVRETLLP
jgi:sphingolipid 4-desaturase/C4-monooxygenase